MKLRPLKLTVFVVTTFSILILISSLLFYKNFVGILTAWNQANKMLVYLKVDTLPDEKDKLIQQLKQNPEVAQVAFVDRAAATQSFQNSLKEFSTGLITEDEMQDLVPETLEVDLQSRLSLK